MTSFFISDIHLSDSNNKLSSAFINFLKKSKNSCSQLFILGDLFEVWIGDDHQTDFIDSIKSELLNFTTNGPDTYFMHGNRDFLIGEKFTADTGIKILPDPYEININNNKVLLSHGDFLCTDDIDYINFRNQVRDKSWQKDFLGKSIEERNEIASKLRSDSNDATQNKSSEITDVNELSVKKIINDYSPNIFIHGHTHRPNVHEYASSKRIVLGDWGDFGWYLYLDEKSCNLEKFSIA